MGHSKNQNEWDTVSTRFLDKDECSFESKETTFPLIIQPKSDSSASFLEQFGQNNNLKIRQLLQQHGAILFRGFDITQAEEFERVVKTLNFNLTNNYTGVAARNKITEHVYASTAPLVPLPLVFHTEMGYLNHRPRMISFFCHTAPPQYGETPIFNLRAALNSLNPEYKELLINKKLKYTRILKNSMHRFEFGNRQMTWPVIFGSHDKEVVKSLCESSNISCTWKGDDLIAGAVISPITRHPETRELALTYIPCDLNGCLNEIKRMKEREGVMRRLQWRVIFRILFLLKRASLYLSFGDGAKFDQSLADHLYQKVWEHSVVFRWQQGDILVLDNILTAHARLNVVQPRKILVCMSEAENVEINNE